MMELGQNEEMLETQMKEGGGDGDGMTRLFVMIRSLFRHVCDGIGVNGDAFDSNLGQRFKSFFRHGNLLQFV